MTYNVFRGTLNPTQSKPEKACFGQFWAVFFENLGTICISVPTPNSGGLDPPPVINPRDLVYARLIAALASHRKPERDHGAAPTSRVLLIPSWKPRRTVFYGRPTPICRVILDRFLWRCWRCGTARCRQCCFSGRSRCQGMSTSDALVVCWLRLLAQRLLPAFSEESFSTLRLSGPRGLCGRCQFLGRRTKIFKYYLRQKTQIL